MKMSLLRLVTALLLWVLLVTAAEEGPTKPAVVHTTPGPGPGQAAVNGSTTRTAGNSTDGDGRRKLGGFSVDSSMIQRALYVLIAITLIGVLYFLVRAVRLKKPGQKKKYGLLSNYDDSVEMEGMESEEDDTLYEARGLRR